MKRTGACCISVIVSIVGVMITGGFIIIAVFVLLSIVIVNIIILVDVRNRIYCHQHYHSAAFRQYLFHSLFLICQAYWFCPTILWAWQVNQSTNISTKQWCICESFSLCKDKDCAKDAVPHSIDPLQFYTWKSLYPHYFSLVDCTPREVIRHLTFNFDECQIDLGMQMSFLNAVPLSIIIVISWKYQNNNLSCFIPVLFCL